MSYKATGWAYELPLKGPAKIVLVALADFADEAGSCYPGQEKLCQMTGLSIRTLRRALERLEAAELIKRERRFDPYGHRTSDRYFLQLDAQSLPATLTSGHSDPGSESPSLPVRESIPTGHSDRVTIRRTTREPSGGREAPTPTPEVADNSNDTAPQKLGDGGVSPHCTRHPDGTDRPCAGCKKQRLAWEQALADAEQHRIVLPLTTTPSKSWRPGLCIPHLQKLGHCGMCEREGVA